MNEFERNEIERYKSNPSIIVHLWMRYRPFSLDSRFFKTKLFSWLMMIRDGGVPFSLVWTFDTSKSQAIIASIDSIFVPFKMYSPEHTFFSKMEILCFWNTSHTHIQNKRSKTLKLVRFDQSSALHIDKKYFLCTIFIGAFGLFSLSLPEEKNNWLSSALVV